MNYRITLSPLAQKDLKNIEKYISKDNPEAAKRFCDKLLTAAESLESFPYRGSCADSKQARTLVCKPYIIFYDVDSKGKEVQILRFWHAARDQGNLRLKEEAYAVYEAVKVGA